MPFINIGKIATFATNIGVLVHEDALSESPETLYKTVQTAYDCVNNVHLADACCGGRGPLAQYSQLSFEEFLAKLREIEQAEINLGAKRTYTGLRRSGFNGRRKHLVLALLAAGVSYKCAEQGCEEREDLTLDHILALSLGGTDDLSNLRFLCRSHNSAKGDKPLD